MKSTNYRASKYLNFDSGDVFVAPMDLTQSLQKPWSNEQKLDIFECRIEVWTLGVATAILRQIEDAQTPSIWQHGAYCLLTSAMTYFEMIGKTLNAASQGTGTAREDFNVGFCDVYPRFKPSNAIYADKLPGCSRRNDDIQAVVGFRDRARNGLYHLGNTKAGLWIHDDARRTEDFEIAVEADPTGLALTVERYRVNPHRLTRTTVNHFPTFLARVRKEPDLTTRFIRFFDQILNT